MLSLKSRQDQWRLLFPKTFLVPEVQEKYSKILRSKNSFLVSPIDFLNESIQSIQVLGFQNATIQQMQTATGSPMRPKLGRIQQNAMYYQASEFSYRSDISPLNLLDKTLNINFRHTLGYLNYFMLFDNFMYLYSRDSKNNEMLDVLTVDIPDENGAIICKLKLKFPVMDSMDMLDLNYSQPIATSQTFQVQFKFSNYEIELLGDEFEEE